MELLISKLDTLTLIFCVGIFAAIMATISFFLSNNFPIKIHGLKEWGISMTLVSCSFFLFFFRGWAVFPQVLTVLGANVLAITSSAIAFYAWCVLLRKQINKNLLLYGTLLPIIAITFIYFYTSDISLILFYFSIIITSGSAIFYTLTAFQIFNVVKNVRSIAAIVSIISISFLSIIFFVRVFKTITGDPDSTLLMAQSAIQILFFVIINIAIMATSVGFIMMVTDEIRRQIIERSKRDGLTGVYTRKAFTEKVSDLEKQIPYSILMLDIDNFKKINDDHGHRMGDTALIHIAKIIVSNMRSCDMLARYGGEEFCIMIQGNKKAGLIFSERLLEAIRNSPVRSENKSIPMTASIGCAWTDGSEYQNLDSLLDTADALLYKAKNSGKDTVCF